ncbi:helix-turn-helix transcriptional regulator [Streptomyces thermolineatus]|uniref:Helix-turn-helix transcriptional regulator n=1 Tax=Streptomyces thermolineatus TaxID=44033 RepID=A0ABP5ZFU8_9ACTN
MASDAGVMDERARRELASFLRSCRERAGLLEGVVAAGTPDGGPDGGPPRTRGLRPEEVSVLSGLSLTWYTWLEQGRSVAVSEPALRALAAALGLGPRDRAELFRLAGRGRVAERPALPPATAVGADVRLLLDSLVPNPAFVVDRCFDVLAWNRAASALAGGLGPDRPPAELNVLWLVFNEPWMGGLLPDRDAEAARLVAELREVSPLEMDNPRFTELVASLQRTNGLFRDLWNGPDARPAPSAVRRFRHPDTGDLTLTHLRLAVEGTPGHSVVVHLAGPGSPEEGALRRLCDAPAGRGRR